MSTHHVRQGMRSVTVTEDAPESPVGSFRRNIATRNEELAREYPRAVDLEANALLALHDEINGEATRLRGLRSGQAFRSALVGQKNITLADLCRLATDPTREAKESVRAALRVLAAAVGHELKPLNVAAMEAHEALAEVASSHGAAMAQVSISLADDGRLDENEARVIEPHLEAAQCGLDRLKATVSRAKEGR